MTTFSYRPFNSKIEFCSIVMIHGKLHYEGEPKKKDPLDEGLSLVASTCNDGWGYVKNLDVMTDEEWPMPNRLTLRYITKNDGRCYAIDTPLDDALATELWQKQQQEHPNDPFKDYVVGTAPFGVIAIWLRGRTCSVLLHQFRAVEVELNELEQIYYGGFRKTGESEIISKKELEDNMRQFSYRYVALEEHWDWDSMSWVEYEDDDPFYDDLDIDSVEDQRADGSFNHIRGDENQLKYHTAGKPFRITIRWHAGPTEYMAHFWLTDFLFTRFFNEFFEKQPDTKPDFILRLDPQKQVYQLALKGDKNKSDFVFPMGTYQLIVFKDGEEHYTSPNYFLEDGQWSWLWRKKEKAPETAQGNDG